MKAVVIPNGIKSVIFFSTKEMSVLVKFLENPAVPRTKAEEKKLVGIKRGLTKAQFVRQEKEK